MILKSLKKQIFKFSINNSSKIVKFLQMFFKVSI